MRESTKIRLKHLLTKELGREPSENELGNAATDHNLMAQLAIELVEEAHEDIAQVESVARNNEARIDQVDKDIEKIDQASKQ